VNPNTGAAVYAGYVVHINGIDISLFNGSPSEATAFSTFSTDVLTLTPMPSNGDVTLNLVSAGTFSVYYNTTPDGDWSNPATFASGRLIATFERKQSLYPEIGPIGFHDLSEVLVYSRDFTFGWSDSQLQQNCPQRDHLGSVFQHCAANGNYVLSGRLCRRGLCGSRRGQPVQCGIKRRR